MYVAWADALMFAAAYDPMRDAFETETKMSLPTGKPLDQMIDAATGYDKAVAEKFIEWFNEKVWGA